jgi:hypothetical protein
MNTDAIITAAFNPRLRASRLPCPGMDGLELPASTVLRPEVFFTPVDIRSLVTPGRLAALSLSRSYVRLHALSWTASSYQRVNRSDPPSLNTPAEYLRSLVTPSRFAAFSPSRSSVRFHALSWTAGSYQRVLRSATPSVNTPAGLAPLAGNSEPRCGFLCSAPLPSFRLDGCGGLASGSLSIRLFLLYFARNASRSLVPRSRLRVLPSFFRPFPDAGLDGLELPASLQPETSKHFFLRAIHHPLAGNSGPIGGFLYSAYSAPLPSFRLDGCGGLASSGSDIWPFLLYFARNASRSLVPHSRLRAFSPYPSLDRFHALAWTAGSYQRAHHKPKPPYLTVKSILCSLVTSSRLRAFSPYPSPVRFHALPWTASSYQRVPRSDSPSIKNTAGYLHSLVTPSRVNFVPLRLHASVWTAGRGRRVACRNPLRYTFGRFFFVSPVSPSRVNFVSLRFHASVWTAGRGRRVCLPMPPDIIIRSDFHQLAGLSGPHQLRASPLTCLRMDGRERPASCFPKTSLIKLRSVSIPLAGLSEPFQRRSRPLPSRRLDGFGLPASQPAGGSLFFFTGRHPFDSLVTLSRLRKAGGFPRFQRFQSKYHHIRSKICL